jgi:hypothetical protein
VRPLKGLIDVRDLRVYFPIRKNFIEEIFSRSRLYVKALDDEEDSRDHGGGVQEKERIESIS